MITSEALAKTIDTDPQFNVRILFFLSKATLPITVNELECLYIETFRLDFSPLAHSNKTEKGYHYLYRSNDHCPLPSG